MRITRFVGVLALTGALTSLTAATSIGREPATVPAPLPTVTVYKTPTCGCCGKWVEYMKASGFKVVVHDMDDLSEIKAFNGVRPALRSCHTAIVGGYVIEGHVPADLVKKLLTEHPKVAGLAVPGMVTGSPGMEGGTPEHYDVISWDNQGHTAVYARR
jgi:hypothetical protein